MEKEFYDQIMRKLAYLEDRIIDLLHRTNPWSFSLEDRRFVQDFSALISKPIKIDDRELASQVREVSKFASQLLEMAKTTDLGQTLSEIKYIGNRLKIIEEYIAEMKNDGIKRKIQCTIQMEGIQDVTNQENEHEKYQEEVLARLLEKLEPDERLAVVHKCGLKGNVAISFAKLGKMLNTVPGNAKIIYSKALRKMRRNDLKRLVNRLDKVVYKKLIQDLDF